MIRDIHNLKNINIKKIKTKKKKKKKKKKILAEKFELAPYQAILVCAIEHWHFHQRTSNKTVRSTNKMNTCDLNVSDESRN
jgi:hypothetical protein